MAGIAVATINSETPQSSRQQTITDLQCGHPRTKLLYVTPELCLKESFRRTLRTVHGQGQLCRIAIDEAHCISEWGHDFRPSFKELSFFRTAFPDVPIICATATATRRVREDIIAIMGLDAANLKLFTMTTSRPNLHYEVRFKSDSSNEHYHDFLRWLRSVHARRTNAVRAAELGAAAARPDAVSGIIYTSTRASCEQLAAQLVADGIGAKPFHAGLPAAAKDDHLAGWVGDRRGYEVVVATTAFGMGIDKDGVRFVAHWQLPKSFEGFYQEAGRAGRDGRAALCIMYYGREDRDRVAHQLERDAHRSMGRGVAAVSPQMRGRMDSFRALAEYCEATAVCRHRAISRYFGEEAEPPCDAACDWHKDAAALIRRKDRDLASEEWCLTQRTQRGYYDDDYD